MSIWVGALLAASQIALVVLSPGLTHAAVRDFADVAPLVGLLSASAAVGLVYMRSIRAIPARLSRASPLWPMVGLGLAMRLVWFATAPPLEDDFYRYLWDGAAVASGRSPYALSPAQAATGQNVTPSFDQLAETGRSTLERINFPEYTSIYPGAAQLAFGAAHIVAPWSVDGLRLIFAIADVATLGIMFRLLDELNRPRMLAALYWCNPLVVFAGAATVHVDLLLGPLVLGAMFAAYRMRSIACSALLALAVGVKIWPILLAPLIARAHLDGRRYPVIAIFVFGIAAAILLAPLFAASFTDRSGLAAYAAHWQNNNAPFTWLCRLFDCVSGDDSRWTAKTLRYLSGVSAAAVAVIIAMRPIEDLRDLLGRALIVAATVFYLSPAQFPWYALWFLPLAAAVQCWPLLLASVTLPAYYLFFPMAAMGERALFQNGVAILHAAPVWAWLLWRRIHDQKTHCASRA